MRTNPIDAGTRFIENFFPNSTISILAGSVVRKEDTSSSDLDIVIIDEMERSTSRRCFKKYGWPIETFVYNKKSFYTFFEGDCILGNPFLPRMCAEGIILRGGERAKQLQQEAKNRLLEGPLPWTADQIEYARYMLTDTLEDLEGSVDAEESIFITSKLAELAQEFILRTNRKWVGQGKWIVRALRQYDEQISNQFVRVFDEFYKNRNKEAVIRYIDSILQPFGGRLFDGYKQ